MQAVIFNRYGSADVLQLTTLAKPTPKAHEVLIRIHAAGANPADWRRMSSTPFLVRLDDGLFKPKNPMLGADVAGEVVAVGPGVTQFQPGDAVYGDLSMHNHGAFAEYVSVPEKAVVEKPANISYQQAAAVPLAGITALQGLRDEGRIQAGQKVLVNGASGGVGTFAVQIAKALGAHVTGVCSTRNLDMVRSIGADAVVDYTREDFTRTSQKYDLVFDAVGNRTVADLKRSLAPKGTAIVAGFTTIGHLFHVMIRGGLASRGGKVTIRQMKSADANAADLRYLNEFLANDLIVPVIDRCYPLSKTAEALHYLQQGHARGKVIINVMQS